MSLCYKMARRLCLLVVILFLFQVGESLAVEKKTLQSEKLSGVDFKDGLLKVSVENQRFKEVMDDVAKKAGIKILIYYPVDEKLSVSFDYIPLEKGLRRLLREKNYAFTYQSGEGDVSKSSAGLMKVFVFSKLEGLGVDRQAMDMDEIQNQIREKLDEALVLQNLPQRGVDIEKQFRQAMDEIKKTGIFAERTEFEGGTDIEEQIKKALQVIQGKGNKL